MEQYPLGEIQKKNKKPTIQRNNNNNKPTEIGPTENKDKSIIFPWSNETLIPKLEWERVHCTQKKAGGERRDSFTLQCNLLLKV